MKEVGGRHGEELVWEQRQCIVVLGGSAEVDRQTGSHAGRQAGKQAHRRQAGSSSSGSAGKAGTQAGTFSGM